MRILVNYMLRERWAVSCLADDARTPISPYVFVSSQETLLRLLRYAGANDAEIESVETDIRRWHRGTVKIELAPGRKNLLRLRAPWNLDLLPRDLV